NISVMHHHNAIKFGTCFTFIHIFKLWKHEIPRFSKIAILLNRVKPHLMGQPLNLEYDHFE
ncbi:hypothetical protein ABEB36_004769, partial [Hypothenemus hampei]